VIGKTQAARQPSIDELLASIRQAIHERVTPDALDRRAPDELDRRTPDEPVAQARSPSLVHAGAAAWPQPAPRQQASQGDESLNADSGAGVDGARMKRTIVTRGHEGFAGLLGGDVRLEEALARLNRTGWRGGETPGVAETAREAAGAVAIPPAEPGLRPTIDEWTGGLTAPVAPTPIAAVRGQPAASISPPRRGEPAPDPGPPGAFQRAAPERTDELWEEEPIYDNQSAAPRPPQRPAHASAGAKPEDLLSSEAARVANSAFGRLADAVGNRFSGGEWTLDEITRECLRPLLKAWLDDNLPGLVERLVREEIERVARPGR
jgi:uncharacterized protein